MKFFSILFFAFLIMSHAKSDFERFGDIAQLTPIVVSAIAFGIGDKTGAYESMLSAGVSAGATFIFKQSFIIASRSDVRYSTISKRPAPHDTRYDGFPSGHTSFVFSSVGFAAKRYGAKIALPLATIGTLVGASRISSNWHTTTQVLAGAALGFGVGYFITSDSKKSYAVLPNLDHGMGVAFYKVF